MPNGKDHSNKEDTVPTPEQHNVIAGPTKEQLKSALFEGINGELGPGGQNSVKFTLGGKREIVLPVRIESVSREDGSAESWLYEGYVPSNESTARFGERQLQAGRVQGYYSTKTGTGDMTLTFSSF